MLPNPEILRILFNNQLFAESDSKLARLLGYGEKSRSTIRRIKNGESLKEGTIADVWEKLKELFFISDEEIICIANCVAYGHNLLEELQNVYGVGNGWHEQAFKSLITEDYAAISEKFDTVLSVHLNDMKLQEPEVYYGMIAYCYILCKKITPYTVEGRKKLNKQLDELNSFLHLTFPANSRAKLTADKTISMELGEENLTLIKLLYSLRVVFANYIDEEFFEGFLRDNGELLDTSEYSFWITPGETFGKDCELWFLSVVATKSQLHGSYIAMRLRARNDAKDSFELVESYNFLFMKANDQEGTQILQVYDMPTGKIDYVAYGYSYDEKTLELFFDEERGNTFALPAVLRQIDTANPKNKDEKVWAHIVNEMVESDKCWKILLQAINSSAESDYEYLDEYEITNVAIDRKNITITMLYENVESTHTLPVENYPFLANLTPAEYVSVARSKSNGELYFTWNNLGQFIPMKEFRQSER